MTLKHSAPRFPSESTTATSCQQPPTIVVSVGRHGAFFMIAYSGFAEIRCKNVRFS